MVSKGSGRSCRMGLVIGWNIIKKCRRMADGNASGDDEVYNDLDGSDMVN